MNWLLPSGISLVSLVVGAYVWPLISSKVRGKVWSSGKGADILDALSEKIRDGVAKLRTGDGGKPAHDTLWAMAEALYEADATLHGPAQACMEALNKLRLESVVKKPEATK